MSLFNTAGIILALVAALGYINYRWIKLPDVIGMTAVSLILSVMAVFAGNVFPEINRYAEVVVAHIDFPELVFHGMLGLLLFAGSMHVDLSALKSQKAPVMLLATAGVLISTILVGTGTYLLFEVMGLKVPFLMCLLFGAIISPTDPIAVLAILKKAHAPESLEMKIVGESLFNDGTAVVTFMAILAIMSSGVEPSFTGISLTLLREIGGGITFGLLGGYLGYRMLRDIDSYAVEIVTTLAMAIGGYGLAEVLHVSAPLAVVTMGLFIGNHGVKYGMSEKTRSHLLPFWELLDELLNLVLFALIGLVVVSLVFQPSYLMAGLMTIPMVLLARAASIWIPMFSIGRIRSLTPHAVKLMTWGGLRGGISVAMAISLPQMPGRDAIIAITYIVVVFSLLVQATTLGRLMERLKASA